MCPNNAHKPLKFPVTVLMALYQGERFLREQLDSIAAQGDGWRLIVSDDGSTDAGPQIVQEFAAGFPERVDLRAGPGKGAPANFRAMLQTAPSGFVALADQDDVWLPAKLQRAFDRLTGIDGPALYCSRVVICDEALNRIGESRPVYPPSFPHALVQNVVQGNTVVLNPAALALVQEAGEVTPPVVMHDWWLYQLISGVGGKIIFDAEPSVLYRQHASNVVGANGGLAPRLASFRRMLSGNHRDWSAATIAALTPVHNLFTPENCRIFAEFETLHQGSLPQRLAAMRRGSFRRQGAVSQTALWLAAALGRI